MGYEGASRRYDVDKFANSNEVVGSGELSVQLLPELELARAKNNGQQPVKGTPRFKASGPTRNNTVAFPLSGSWRGGNGYSFPVVSLPPFQPSSPSPTNLDFWESCIGGHSRRGGQFLEAGGQKDAFHLPIGILTIARGPLCKGKETQGCKKKIPCPLTSRCHAAPPLPPESRETV